MWARTAREAGGLLARAVTPVREAELERLLLDAARDGVSAPVLLHVSHFATCPNAGSHRRARAAS